MKETDIKTIEALTEYRILVNYLINKLENNEFIDNKELFNLLNTFNFGMRNKERNDDLSIK